MYIADFLAGKWFYRTMASNTATFEKETNTQYPFTIGESVYMVSLEGLRLLQDTFRAFMSSGDEVLPHVDAGMVIDILAADEKYNTDIRDPLPSDEMPAQIPFLKTDNSIVENLDKLAVELAASEQSEMLSALNKRIEAVRHDETARAGKTGNIIEFPVSPADERLALAAMTEPGQNR